MKLKEYEAENISRAISQLFKKGRVVVAHESGARVLSPHALASTTRNKRWMGGPVNILLNEEVTPYDLSVALEYLIAVLADLPSEDAWPDDDVFSV